MSIIEEAKFCLKDLKSIETHILQEYPSDYEREAAFRAIKMIWYKFISKITEHDIEKYKINIKERKLDNMYSVLESIIGY